MQPARGGNQRVEVAVVGVLDVGDVVVAFVAGDDDVQVIVLHQGLGDERPRDAAVAVGEGVDDRR